VCLVRIKEKVGEKRSTVCTHRYPDCLLKNTSTKHNKYVVNQKHEQVLVGSTGKDDSDLPKAVQVHISSNVFRHSISEKSVLQLSKKIQ
jgi:hypothetical protein